MIRENERGKIEFWVPFYKKKLYNAFYPYTNGESGDIQRNIFPENFMDSEGNFDLSKIIQHYKSYVKKRGFNPFREKDAQGNYKSIKAAALVYSFETYIQSFLLVAEGRSYREARTGLSKSDLIIFLNGKEYLIETKIFLSV